MILLRHSLVAIETKNISIAVTSSFYKLPLQNVLLESISGGKQWRGITKFWSFVLSKQFHPWFNKRNMELSFFRPSPFICISNLKITILLLDSCMNFNELNHGRLRNILSCYLLLKFVMGILSILGSFLCPRIVAFSLSCKRDKWLYSYE